MNILGITAPISWNSAAAIVKNGKFLGAVEEERFNGIKHAPRMIPLKSIEYCLAVAKLKPEDVDMVALSFRPPWNYYILTALENFKHGDYNRALRESGTMFEYFMGMIRLKEWMVNKGFRINYKKEKLKFFYCPHHLAHAASAYRCSGFDEANIITIDGQGEDDAGMLGIGRKGKIKKLAKIGHHQSIGWVYTSATELLGFLPHSHEGKVMGLAGWGKRVLPVGDDIWKVGKDDFKICNNWKIRFLKRFGPPRGRYDDLTVRHKNIALTVQRFTEDAGVALATKLHRWTKIRNFCLAGGVALNCDMNAKIWSLDFVDDIFIQPASNDAGAALGAALEAANSVGENVDFKMIHGYWGPKYSDKQIETQLRESKWSYKKIDKIAKYTAREIADGKIVAWFQGRLEFGPRALGNRSILVHPGLPGMKDKVNIDVKHRETWRPFAPSIMDEYGDEYFTNYIYNPFMLITLDVKKEKFIDISQAMHVDSTARHQSVTKKSNKRYYELISEFRKLTGIPVLLNTSFNDAGQPIVNTPKEAIKTFAGTGIDILVMGNYVVCKQ